MGKLTIGLDPASGPDFSVFVKTKDINQRKVMEVMEMRNLDRIIIENRLYLQAWTQEWERRMRRALAEHEGEG